jgi:hemoglobin/transferrin/lactoferrin receptor protein
MFKLKRLPSLLLGGSLLFGPAAWGQTPPSSTQPTPLPGTTVEGTRPTTPVPGMFPPGYDQQLPAGTGTASSPAYNGSPLGDYSGRPSSLFGGAPTDPFNAPRSFSTLDQVRVQQQSPVSTPEVLEMIPGVLIQRTNVGGGSLIIRGRNGNQNLIMVDGIPINDAGWRFSNVQYLNTIDPGVIDRIEVIRGPASVLYGSGAMGGVLNIITKSRREFSQCVGLNGALISNFGTAGESGYGRFEVSGNIQDFGFLGGGSFLSTGALHAGQDVLFPEFATGYDQTAFDVRLDWRMSNCWSATFVFQHLFQNDIPRTDRFPLPEVNPTRFEDRPTFTNQRRDFGYIRFGFANDAPGWINGFTITANLQHRNEQETETLFASRDPVTGALVPQRTRERAGEEDVIYGGLDLRGYTNLGGGNILAYGATWQRDDVNALRNERRSALPGQSLEDVRPRAITPTLPNDGAYEQFGIFLYDTWDLTDWLTFTGGGRYSSIAASGTARAFNSPTSTTPPQPFDVSFQDWTGEFGTVVKVTDGIHVYGSVAEGFRAPNLEDLGADERSTAQGTDNGNVNLEPERLTNFETGVKFRNEWFAGSAAVYHSQIESQIVRTRVGTGTAATNGRTNTRGWIDGIEIEGVVFLGDNWSLFAAGSRQLGVDETRGEPLRMPPAFLTSGVRWSYRGPTVGLFVEGFVEMMDEQTRLGFFDLQDIRVPDGGTSAWQTLNFRGGIDNERWGRLTVGVYNVFDQNYRILGSGVDAPGLDFRAGYEVRF